MYVVDADTLPQTLAVLGGPVDSVGPRYADVAELGATIDAGAPVPDVVLTAPVPAHAPTHDGGPALVEAAHAATRATLDLLQAWLADERFAGSQLVVVTRGAVAVRPGEVPDLVAAPIRGLVRSAQSEHPGRFVALDLDTDDVPWPALLASDEPQLALRDGSAFAPRMRRTTREMGTFSNTRACAAIIRPASNVSGTTSVAPRHRVQSSQSSIPERSRLVK